MLRNYQWSLGVHASKGSVERWKIESKLSSSASGVFASAIASTLAMLLKFSLNMLPKSAIEVATGVVGVLPSVND